MKIKWPKKKVERKEGWKDNNGRDNEKKTEEEELCKKSVDP
jgi:hypothetical protein